ncbi:MAG: fatty acid desaturase [Pseudomonadota bacterium]
MLNGSLDLTAWGLVAAILIMTHVTIAAVTIYLHRHQAHRALELHPVVSHFFRFWLWLSTGMRTVEWVAIHRKHHVKCETPEDPHSPQVLGLRKVLWQGAELYQKEADNIDTLEVYGKGTPDDWIERNVYRYSSVGIGIMLLADLVLFGIAGITVWAIQMLWIPFWAAGVINGVGHYWGYRNYECPDAATNIIPWGILVGGEELHNNHHTFSSSAKLSSRWWEFDIGWLYIRLLEMVALARVKKIAPRPLMGPVKPAVDMDTVRAVLANRFQVMAHYSKTVLLPVFHIEFTKTYRVAGGLKRRARKALVLNEGLLTQHDQHLLDFALGRSEALEIVYRYKQQLQQLWERSGMRQENLLQALQLWCKQAESSGVAMLEAFACHLRAYTLQPALAAR